MKSEHYILQYHIYLTAIDKYLQLRYKGYSYEKNFGGVYYIFLRGIDGKRIVEFILLYVGGDGKETEGVC